MPTTTGSRASGWSRSGAKADRHDLRDLTVDVALEGDFTAAHVDGDNANLVATDTMKNTVYALAREHLTGPAEAFGLELARHFAAKPQVDRALVTLREHGWQRIPLAAGPAPDAFTRIGDLTRVAAVAASKTGASIEAGIEDLTIMKTAKSAFSGFERDRYTTLPDADDRIMATKITALWGYAETAVEPGFDFDAAFDRARSTLLTVLAEHQSPSVQTSVWIMGTAMLEAEPVDRLGPDDPAEPPPLDRRPRCVRAGQPGRSSSSRRRSRTA